MRPVSEMSLLFATNFSDTCFRSIPAVAHWMDDLGCRLTLLHVYDPQHTTRDAAARQLQSFFPEAEHYGYCHRLVMSARTPAVAIREHCEQYAHDLLVLPGGDHVGLPRFGQSLRAQLQRHVAVPLWTFSAAHARQGVASRARQVACWVSDVRGANAHVASAASMAERLGAALQVLYVLPEVHEGMLSASLDPRAQPVGEATARMLLQKLVSPLGVTPEFHIGRGNLMRELHRLVSAHQTDLLFAGTGQVLKGGLFGPRLRAAVRTCPCPVICMDGASQQVSGWPVPERSVAWLPEIADRQIAHSERAISVSAIRR